MRLSAAALRGTIYALLVWLGLQLLAPGFAEHITMADYIAGIGIGFTMGAWKRDYRP